MLLAEQDNENNRPRPESPYQIPEQARHDGLLTGIRVGGKFNIGVDTPAF